VFVSDYHPGVAAGQRQVAGTTRDRVVREALGSVSTEYVVCIDADTTTDRPLGEAVGAAQRAGLDVASVPLRVANKGSLLTRLQTHEYRMSMRLRRLMPWLCSGACHLGRTAALREVMLRHSLFFQGNDAELGLIASQLGLRVGHLDFPVPTSVPSSPYAWWRQRFAWAGGEFRLWVVNARLARRHPWFVLYGAGLVHLCWPLRVMSLASPGWLLLGVAIVYIGVVLALNWTGRDYALLVYPLYGLLSSVVLVPLGVLSYVRMALASRNAGVIRAARRTDEQAHSFVEPLAS
jgi:cellulose synthase/poly-beta-1,6-N-acetylglucosamine synthase-like glycosyltransferase